MAKWTVWAAVLVCCIASPALAESLSLDAEWQLCRTANAAKPDAEWTPVTVPSFVSQSDGKPFLWYRRTFTVPAAMAGKHLFLRFQAVKFVTTVYLNGKEVGGHFGGWEPFEIDITKACRTDGPNDLLVRVQDVTGVIDAPMDYGKQGRGIRFIEQAKDAILAPIGSQYYRVGIWQPVSLIARPDVYIEDVWVRTSVRKKQIEADITLRNLSAKPRTVRLAAQVQKAGLTLTAGAIKVPARSSATVTLRRAWENPRLWTPEDPHLYVLSVLCVLSRPTQQAEAPTDTAATRFGFREFWIDGPNFVLNGTPMKFLATAGHPRGQIGKELGKEAAKGYYRRLREAGCVAMRLHANVWPKAWFEAADEVGMPLIMESALFCYSRNYALTKDAFWKNYHDHLRAIVRDHQNHPSIVMISLENEILHCGGERCAQDCEHRLAEAGRLVKKLDPTRPIMFDADGDPEGVADVVNLHYPLDFNTQNLWPDVGYWLEKGMKVRGWPHTFYKWDKKKPLYFGEFLHIQHYREPDPFTTLLGDGAYAGYDLAMARCKAIAWEMQIKAYRATDVSGQCPWTLTETGPFPSDDNPRYLAVKRAYRPIAAFIRECDTRFYAGETVKRTIDLYNDTPHPAKLTVEWELEHRRDEKVIQSGRRVFDARPAQRIPFTIELKMPDTDPEGMAPLALTVHVKRDGQFIFGDRPLYWAYERQPVAVPKEARVALFEGREKALGMMFRDAGWNGPVVRDLAKLPEADILVIAPHALDGLGPPGGAPIVGDGGGRRGSLARFVRDGGTVIVLEQNSYDCGLLPARLTDRGCTIAFHRAGPPPPCDRWLVADSEFCFWRGDHVVARKTVTKPTHGRFLACVDSGGPEGLVYLPLLEVRDGKGRYFLSQFLIGEKLATEPMAQEMLETLLRWGAALRGGATAPVALAVVQDKLPITDSLEEIGARFEDISGRLAEADLSPCGVLLVEADAPETASGVAKLRRFVEGGGTLIAHGGTRDGIARLQRLFPEPIVAQPSTSVPVGLAERQWDGVVRGLTRQDLYWYGSREGLSWRTQTPLSADVCDHVIGTGLPDPKACRTFEAEKMATDHGQPSFRDDEVYMYSAAGVKRTIDFPQGGEYAFIVRGKGTPVSGVYPQIAIAIDGKRRGSITTAGEKWGEYFMTAQVAKGRHHVTLAFVNDAWAPERGEDRNVALDWLRIGPVPPMKAKRLLNPPALVKLALGKGAILLDQIRWDKRPGDPKAMRYLSCLLTNLGCDFRSPMMGLTLAADAFKPKEGVRLATVRNGVAYMGTNGTIATRVRFAKAGHYEFAVRASGSKAGGAFPNIALSVDGKKLGDLTLRRETWHTLRLEADVPAGEHEIGLAFTNDYYDDTQTPPADRNLRIAGLAIR